MALHYNLAKVYSLSQNDPEFVFKIVTLFVNEIPEDIAEIKHGIKTKDHKHAYSYSHKVKPTLDLFGMKVAFEEILQVEAWTKTEGEKKAIIETFKSLKHQVKDAVKELKKDFNL
jgi:HPt (histidine-containing phosphotransfer) domain-containing protein